MEVIIRKFGRRSSIAKVAGKKISPGITTRKSEKIGLEISK